MASSSRVWPLVLTGVGLGVTLLGHALGLFVAPPEATMGETVRILYLHVPTAWAALLCFTAAFVAAVGVLWSGAPSWDALQESAVEVGVVATALLLVQGSLWARPTWHTWWTWDPRLTTSAILLVAFVGVLVLRRLLHRPERRAVASAVATIAAFVDVPVVYFSVKWWRSEHQPISSVSTVDTVILLPLLVTLLGMALFTTGVVGLRWRIARSELSREEAAPELPERPPPLDLGEV